MGAVDALRPPFRFSPPYLMLMACPCGAARANRVAGMFAATPPHGCKPARHGPGIDMRLLSRVGVCCDEGGGGGGVGWGRGGGADLHLRQRSVPAGAFSGAAAGGPGDIHRMRQHHHAGHRRLREPLPVRVPARVCILCAPSRVVCLHSRGGGQG